jgi:hypothetical protein
MSAMPGLRLQQAGVVQPTRHIAAAAYNNNNNQHVCHLSRPTQTDYEDTHTTHYMTIYTYAFCHVDIMIHVHSRLSYI